MLTDSLSIYGGVVDNDLSENFYNEVFTKIAQDKQNALRISTLNSAPGNAVRLYIKHSFSGKPGFVVDRHLVSFEAPRQVGATSVVTTVNVTFAIPRIGAYNDVFDAIGLWRYATHFFQSSTEDTPIAAENALINQIARGES